MNTTIKLLSRRDFLRTSAVVAGGISLVAPFARAAGPGANDKIRLGLIGSGGRGRDVLGVFLTHPEVDCPVVCDVDDNMLGRAVAIVEEKRGHTPDTVKDFRRVLERKDLDCVLVATPDHWHALPTVYACQSGKDVYVEKPLATSIDEGRAMLEASQRHKRVVQMGTQWRSGSHQKAAIEFIQSGKLGKVGIVRGWAYLDWISSIGKPADCAPPNGVDYDLWLGPAPKRPFNPNRFHFNFRWFWDYAGGLMTDWGVNLINMMLMGMPNEAPKSVVALGGKFAYPDSPQETPDTLDAVYEFDGYNMIWEHAQSISNGNYGKDHGMSYIGNNGTLLLTRGGWEVIPDEKRMEAIAWQPNKGNGLDFHTKNFIEVVKSRKMSDLTCPIQDGAHVATVCQMGNISYKTGSKVSWDEKGSKFNESAANSFVAAKYK